MCCTDLLRERAHCFSFRLAVYSAPIYVYREAFVRCAFPVMSSSFSIVVVIGLWAASPWGGGERGYGLLLAEIPDLLAPHFVANSLPGCYMCLAIFLGVVAGMDSLGRKPAVFAISRHEDSRVMTSALCFQICCSIRRKNASMSSAALDVALYAPQMILAALAWMLCRMSSVFCV